MNFRIHFFREGIRKFEHTVLYEYIKNLYIFDQISINSGYLYKIYNKNINFEVLLYVESKFALTDVYRIKPTFLDINFRVEFSILTPSYNAELAYELIYKIANKFNLYIFHELYTDVMPCSIELLRKTFSRIKTAYKTTKVEELQSHIIVDRLKLYDIYKYLDEREKINENLIKENIIAPKPKLLKRNNKFIFAIEWKEQSAIVFPPHLDYIIYTLSNRTYILPAPIILQSIEKFIEELPGFSKGAYILYHKEAKKTKKIINKLFNLNTIMDIEYLELKELID